MTLTISPGISVNPSYDRPHVCRLLPRAPVYQHLVIWRTHDLWLRASKNAAKCHNEKCLDLLHQGYIGQCAHNATPYRERSKLLSIPMNKLMHLSDTHVRQENKTPCENNFNLLEEFINCCCLLFFFLRPQMTPTKSPSPRRSALGIFTLRLCRTFPVDSSLIDCRSDSCRSLRCSPFWSLFDVHVLILCSKQHHDLLFVHVDLLHLRELVQFQRRPLQQTMGTGTWMSTYCWSVTDYAYRVALPGSVSS